MDQPKKSAKGHVKEWWEDEVEDHTLFRFRRLWLFSVLATSLISLVPLLLLFGFNYLEYEKVFKEEVKHPIHLTVSNRSRALESYLNQRLAVLSYVVNERGFADLTDQAYLARVFHNVQQSSSGFVDIGLIDVDGIQRAYVGPYRLTGKNYKEQDWFAEAMLTDAHVSEVFMGYRQIPHFGMAVRGELADGTMYMLRVTLDAATFAALRVVPEQRPGLDAFIITRDRVLQTPSRQYGAILDQVPFAIAPEDAKTVVGEQRDAGGRLNVIGYRRIQGSPFVYVVVQPRENLFGSWNALRGKLYWFLALSVVLILFVIVAGTRYMIRRVREADNKRLAVLHKMEYTAKMASVGRLASGVAHEINNPLAIINAKAGLLEDFITFADDFPRREEFLKHIKPISSSVERCARITRRLLGFAKHMDLSVGQIKVEALLREVLGFLEKESTYRNITINFHVADVVPIIKSDKGRLQQVFLNILNNAITAVDDGGRIDITIAPQGPRHVAIKIRDNGKGISEDNLKHIFEPFFTTNQKHGTGLGLSITYGMVTKLGGNIAVESKEGQWTEFTIVLPVEPDTGASDGRS